MATTRWANSNSEMIPAMMISISLLEFAAEAGVKAADDKEHHDHGDKNQVIHKGLSPCLRTVAQTDNYFSRHENEAAPARAVVKRRAEVVKKLLKRSGEIFEVKRVLCRPIQGSSALPPDIRRRFRIR